MSDFSILEKQMELMQTPKDIADKIIDYCDFNPKDSILEPFLGHGNIFNAIKNDEKYSCDTMNGINFFDWNKKIDYAVSNPPFQILEDGKPINSFILIINRLMEICNKGFFLLINHKLWSSLTVKRLRDWGVNDWAISKIKIFEVKKWYGRYYLVKFEKNGDSLVDYA